MSEKVEKTLVDSERRRRFVRSEEPAGQGGRKKEKEKKSEREREREYERERVGGEREKKRG